MTSNRSCRVVLGIGVFYLLVSSVFEVNGIPYDYGYTPECLPSPPKPQYGGGIVVNPELNDEGLNGWSNYGGAKLAERSSEDGNKFVVAFDRNGSNDSLSQTFSFQVGILYVISAWLQVSHGKSPITAAFKTPSGGIRYAGTVFASSGCWSMLKGGITANASEVAELYFLSEDATVDIWADSISLQPFTQEEWMSHQIESLDKIRKCKVRFQAVDPQGQPLAGASISIQQLTNDFPFGSAINANILTNHAYQNWFTSRFKLTVFENEMKWYSTEKSPGQEDYSVPDAMLQFAKNHSISVRGHNIFWDDPNYYPSWVKALSPADLKTAADRRIQSVAQRYKGQLIHWDVVNENVHYNFLESKLGTNASAYYHRAHEIDPIATPFLNDYNTIERPNDQRSNAANYLEKIKEIQTGGYNGSLGIGLEGHFGTPDLAYVRSSLDMLASAKLPMWITELDVSNRTLNQATFLDQIIREVHAHPAVNAIVLWTAWSPQGCYKMCLTDNNFKNLPTGDVVDKFLGEWKHDDLIGTTDANGYFETSLYHGDYEAKISDPQSFSPSIDFTVAQTTNDSVLNVKLSAIIS